MTEQETKSCQFCGETILSVAIKCKHCGSNLSQQPVAVQQAAEITQPQTDTTQAIAPTDYGIALFAIPVAATLLIWFWIGQMALIHGPRAMLNMLIVVSVVSTAIIVAIEAKKAGMVSDKKAGIYSPTQWFFLMCFLWVITYPVYFFKRKKFGLPSQWIAALVVALVFMSSAVTMGSAINEQQAKLAESLQQMKEGLQGLDNLGQEVTDKNVQVAQENLQIRIVSQATEGIAPPVQATTEGCERNGNNLWYEYEPTVVSLRGKLISAKGETPDEKPITYPAIQLVSPISIKGSNESNYPEDGVTLMQLVLNERLWPIYEQAKGTDVVVTGTLYHRDNGNQQTDVLITATQIDRGKPLCVQ